MVPFAKDRSLVSYRAEAAARLAEVPRGASVVVVLDASRSLTPEEAQAEKAAAWAYLSHFKDANVEIITFNRRAEELFGSFVPVRRPCSSWRSSRSSEATGAPLKRPSRGPTRGSRRR
jgi:hypothetical protein